LPEKRVYTLNKFKEEIVPHFEAEELILIPFILGKNKRIDILSEEIVGEHKKISELIELIRNEVDIEENLDNLGNLLSEHIRKEERELFQLVQEVFSEEQLSKLLNQFSHLNKPKSC
ncbi:MAG TPA: hemerythrin domain-containing protein, partial [Ignavibacteria bacterium]|nr:hemerythrin domain-containing protein [Ignavibacteria bacterium]